MIHISISKQKICAMIIMVFAIIISIALYRQMWSSSDYQIIHSDYDICMPSSFTQPVSIPHMLYELSRFSQLSGTSTTDTLLTRMSLHTSQIHNQDLQQVYLNILHQLQNTKQNELGYINTNIASTYTFRAIKHYQNKMITYALICAVLFIGSFAVLISPTDIHPHSPHLGAKLKTRIIKCFEPKPEDWL